MNNVPAANRIHIGFFGRRNVGKSSLVNAVTGQELAVVSEVLGTTTDPVYKAMELLPLGPVMIIDTPGIDDEGSLGELRVRKTKQVLNKTDIAVLVIDATTKMTDAEFGLLSLLKEKEIPYLVVGNKIDMADSVSDDDFKAEPDGHYISVSAVTKQGINDLKEELAHLVKVDEERFKIVGDLLNPEDVVVLVVPIDSSAPKGRLILPQQQVIRDVLEAGASALVTKDTELAATMEQLKSPPKMVITDSQVFGAVSKIVPSEVPLTSFSILMARWKGFLETAVKGAGCLENIETGDRVLIAEGCTHHRQCEDIGTVKLPAWIRKYTEAEPEFVYCSGTEFPEDLSSFKLIIHCGGCMLNEREIRYRMKCATDQGIPFTNYGTAIAHINGILKRSIMIFEN